MKKDEFFKKNDMKFMSLGFKKDVDDPMFYYSRDLISKKIIEELDLDECDVPKLLYGTTGINSGFCIYTGSHFIWLNVGIPEEAIEIGNKIVAFEEC